VPFHAVGNNGCLGDVALAGVQVCLQAQEENGIRVPGIQSAGMKIQPAMTFQYTINRSLTPRALSQKASY
jgi:hypothetical protein